MAEQTPAGPRQLEAVRRGAVRERRPGQQVAPSAWEHLEMALGGGPDRVSALSLEPGGTFRAALKEQQHDADGHCETVILATANGNWRQCRGGVELVFGESAELDLPELLVPYSLRHGCLVADALELPDGLTQEYSRCSDDSLSVVPLAAERLSLIDRMLADAAANTGVARSSRSPGVTAAGTALHPQCLDGDSDRDECLEGTAPVGIIEEGSCSDLDADGSTGGSTPRCEVQASHGTRKAPCADKDLPSYGKKEKTAPTGGGEDEEYGDDFEGESDDGSEEAT